MRSPVKVITIGSHLFPACDLICPPHHDQPGESIEDLRLAETPHGMLARAYVPAENGALFGVELNPDGTRGLSIVSMVCEENMDDGRGMWLPITLMLDTDRRALVPWRVHGGAWDWRRADAEWVAESIDRWGRWPVLDLPDGPRCTLAPLPGVEA